MNTKQGVVRKVDKDMKSYSLKQVMTNAAQTSAAVRELRAEELQELKNVLTEMVLDVLHVCEAHGFSLMLAGGSALGAVRHQGFIPWDDDLDLMMTREDYVKFCAIFEQTLGDKYLLIAPNHGELYQTRFPKIMKRNTVLRSITDVDSPMLCGIYLDVFLLENIPANRFIQRMKGLWCNLLMFIGSRVYLYERNNPVFQAHMSGTEEAQRALKATLRIGKAFSMIPSRKWSDWVDKAVQYKKETGLLGLPTGRKHYFGEILNKSAFLPPSYGTFEGHRVPLPADCDAYLRNLYGDYMQIPPVDKREKHFIVELQF